MWRHQSTVQRQCRESGAALVAWVRERLVDGRVRVAAACDTHAQRPRSGSRQAKVVETLEIQRLIGRSLRAVMDFGAIGERTITIDCDVLQADGGTRTTAISGAYLALADAVDWLTNNEMLNRNPFHGQVAAVSVGIFQGEPILDLDYAEDSDAETDMNIVMNDAGAFVEVQGTAEGHAFHRGELDRLLDLASGGIESVLSLQAQCLQSRV